MISFPQSQICSHSLKHKYVPIPSVADTLFPRSKWFQCGMAPRNILFSLSWYHNKLLAHFEDWPYTMSSLWHIFFKLHNWQHGMIIISNFKRIQIYLYRIYITTNIYRTTMEFIQTIYIGVTWPKSEPKKTGGCQEKATLQKNAANLVSNTFKCNFMNIKQCH